ncbi:MAG: MarR family winged helix-turn-helix transcriptional regulator [Chitinophagaceae bacterium]
MKEKLMEKFRNASRSYSDASMLMHETIARKAGLSGTDHKFLGMLIKYGEMSAGEISKRTYLTTGAVTALIDRLERKKLVERRFDKTDRRKILIVPKKEKVLKLMEPLFSELQKKTATLVSTFSVAEIEILHRYFSSAVNIMGEVTDNLNKTKK